MLTAEFVNLNEFNRSMNRLITRVGLDAKRVMRKELGELTKTLIRVSPPRNVNKSKKSVGVEVAKKFESLAADSGYDQFAGLVGSTGMKWYAASSKFLFGGAPDSDMRRADVKTLRAVHYKTRTVHGGKRIVVDFKKKRRLQRAAIITKIIVKKGAPKAVAIRIGRNFGRLKAGWLGPVIRGAVTLTGANVPPEMVMRHKVGARADFMNGLDAPGNPNFTIINRAKGVTGKSSKFFIDLALRIRAAAMKKNAEMILSGKKEYTY